MSGSRKLDDRQKALADAYVPSARKLAWKWARRHPTVQAGALLSAAYYGLVRAALSWPGDQCGVSFATWAGSRIEWRLSIEAHGGQRARKRSRPEPLSVDPPARPEHDQVEARDGAAWVRSLVEQLPPKQAAVCREAWLTEGGTVGGYARQTGITKQSARYHYFAAIKSLRSLIHAHSPHVS